MKWLGVFCIFAVGFVASAYGRPTINDIDDDDVADVERCTPGERFKVDCNVCVCADNGKHMYCTLKACLPHKFKFYDRNLDEAAIRKREVDLEKNSRKKRDADNYYDYDENPQFFMQDDYPYENLQRQLQEEQTFQQQQAMQQQQDLLQQQYWQQQQDYEDRQRLQQELEQQKQELQQQQQQMTEQLKYQQQQDQQQLKKDSEFIKLQQSQQNYPKRRYELRSYV